MMSMAELVSKISEIALKKLKTSRFSEVQTPRKKAPQPNQESAVPAQEPSSGAPRGKGSVSGAGNAGEGKRTRYVPASVKRAVFERDGTRCTYVDPVLGRRCTSTHQLQLDHVKPFAQGGETSVENLRVRFIRPIFPSCEVFAAS